MSSDATTTAPTPFHIWVAPYERAGQFIKGHWRPKSGLAEQARTWAGNDAVAPVSDPLESEDDRDEVDERDLPRPQPQRGNQQPPMGASLASDEPPIGEILARLGVDRSEGRRWRRSGKHPALRWSRRYDDRDNRPTEDDANSGELAGV